MLSYILSICLQASSRSLPCALFPAPSSLPPPSPLSPPHPPELSSCSLAALPQPSNLKLGGGGGGGGGQAEAAALGGDEGLAGSYVLTVQDEGGKASDMELTTLKEQAAHVPLLVFGDLRGRFQGSRATPQTVVVVAPWQQQAPVSRLPLGWAAERDRICGVCQGVGGVACGGGG